jgi:hypothetical protein
MPLRLRIAILFVSQVGPSVGIFQTNVVKRAINKRFTENDPLARKRT